MVFSESQYKSTASVTWESKKSYIGNTKLIPVESVGGYALQIMQVT